jgi:hypothetical protein
MRSTPLAGPDRTQFVSERLVSPNSPSRVFQLYRTTSARGLLGCISPAVSDRRLDQNARLIFLPSLGTSMTSARRRAIVVPLFPSLKTRSEELPSGSGSRGRRTRRAREMPVVPAVYFDGTVPRAGAGRWRAARRDGFECAHPILHAPRWIWRIRAWRLCGLAPGWNGHGAAPRVRV